MRLERISKRIKELKEKIYFDKYPLEIEFFETKEELSISEAMKRKNYKKIKPGFLWGEYESYGFFKIKFKTPRRFIDKSLYLLFICDGEGLIYHNGIPLQGVSLNDYEKILFKIEDKVKEIKTYEFYIEVTPIGAFDENNKYLLKKSMFKESSLVGSRKEVIKYYYDLSLLYEIAKNLDIHSLRRNRIEEIVTKSLDRFNFEEEDEMNIIKNAKECDKLLQNILNKNNAPTTEKFYVCGHSHLDVSWLWPFRETIRKIGRTVATTLKYMEMYKEFKFYQTTALYYEILKEQYPELYKKIKDKVKKDRWGVGSVSYIEPDCTISSGESLVRQFLYGIKFSKKEFGKVSNVVWFPDSFGFSASLPQIIKKFGLKYFMTIKINWNDTNKFPYSLFKWEGIDGTKILSYIPPSHYNADINLNDMKNTWKEFKNKDLYDEILYPYGIGDGGGGMNEYMLEYLSRMKNIEGAPKCEHSLMDKYFKVIENKNKNLPVWRGELYLEYHRGVYTTQALNKKYNRLSENLMKEIELYFVIGMSVGFKYPQEEINKLWKLILKNQFHDILPGTSINRVHRESRDEYKEIFDKGEKLLKNIFKFFHLKIDTSGDGIPVIVYNSYSKVRSGVVEIEDFGWDINYIIDDDNNLMPIQKSNGKIIFIAKDVPSLGWKRVWLRKIDKKVENKINVKTTLMENEIIRLKFDKNGRLISIYDKNKKKEILKKGMFGNNIEMYIDKPVEWDAWDIEKNIEDLLTENLNIKNVEILERGPVFGEIKIIGKINNSVMEQRIRIYTNSRRIDFKTRVVWSEKSRLLKVGFPVNIHSNKAVYEIQFGNIERSTTYNTSWDWAKFEVFGHRWADLSEGNYGVALLNDSKYGYSIKDSVMRLSLLRASNYPDKTADRGEHNFTYSLYPHNGDFRVGNVIDEAYDLNIPLKAVVSKSHKGELSSSFSFFTVDKDNVIIDTIKKSEDNNSIVVRLYEAYNYTENVKLKCGFKIKTSYECNLLEDEEKEIKVTENEIKFQIKPYEIKTFKFYF